MGLFLKKKGYHENIVWYEIEINQKKKTSTVTYKINTGDLYIIDSIEVKGLATLVKLEKAFLLSKMENGSEHPLIGKPLDVDLLDEHRYQFSRYLNNSQYHEFLPSNINYLVDTINRDKKAKLFVLFDRFPEVSDKKIKDSLNMTGIKRANINNVHFHLIDTIHYNGNFFQDNKGEVYEEINNREYLKTTESLEYMGVKTTRRQVRKNPELNLKVGDPHPFYKVQVDFNGQRPWVKPELLALQTYLEHKNTYKLEYLERSYRSLQLLNVFESIKPVVIKSHETSDYCYVDVHYFLEPSKKHSFDFEPRFSTNTAGLLGASAGFNYINKNFGRLAQSLTLSFGGGFESQTKSLSSDEDLLFNTLELGPSIKFETPGLLPIPITRLSKRQRPRTVVSSSYNLEKRSIFDRRVFQWSNYWKFYVGKTQIFQIGLPGASSIKYVFFNPKGSFQDYLNTVDDPFFKNTYSKQFIWEDLRFTWDYNNKEKRYKDGKRPFLDANISFQSTFNAAGNLLGAFQNFQNINSEDEFQFLNISYSQFMRIDNMYVLGKKLHNKKSLHFKLNFGAGIPYGNSKTSLPYDYSFFSGGSNDNRGFRARTLGPGAYAYHLDALRLPTQVGDIRLLSSFEYRFDIGSVFRGALFSDIGNIWTFKEDPNRLNSNFEFKDFLEELAFSGGVGLRIDFDFFVFRLDLSFPLYNPAFSNNTKWFFTDLFTNNNFRQSYYSEGINMFTDEVNQLYLDEFGVLPSPDLEYWKLVKEYKLMPKPFVPVLNFGIGYPF